MVKDEEIKAANLNVSLKNLKIAKFPTLAKSVEKTVKTNKWIN